MGAGFVAECDQLVLDFFIPNIHKVKVFLIIFFSHAMFLSFKKF